MSTKCPKNVGKMSKNCPEGLKTQFSDIFWTIFAYLVDAFVGRPVQCSPVTSFGSSGEHLALLFLLALQNTVPRDDHDGFGGFGGCGGFQGIAPGAWRSGGGVLWLEVRSQIYPISRGQKINANFLCTKFLENPSGHGRPRRKSWTSAPRSAFFWGPGDGEKLFDPRASGRKGQECPREIRNKKFMFMLFSLP